MLYSGTLSIPLEILLPTERTDFRQELAGSNLSGWSMGNPLNMGWVVRSRFRVPFRVNA